MDRNRGPASTGTVDRHGPESVAGMGRNPQAVARIPWFHKNYDILHQCVNKIYARVKTTVMIFGVDWNVIERQINAPVHEIIHDRRPFDPKTKTFSEYENPIKFR
jgi:hypothetical protein